MVTKIIAVKPETASVTSYQLEKPQNIAYQPGQFLVLKLPHDSPDSRGIQRNFSLSSSPTDDYFMISVRHGVSTFKKTLEAKKVGDAVEYAGPMGKFVLNENPSIPAVFIAGGIGITPLHAMIKYVATKHIPKPITLIYSNRTSADIPFRTELEQFVQMNPHIALHYTMTQPDQNWTGNTGRIDSAFLQKFIPDLAQPEFYIVGTPRMTLDLKHLVQNLGVPQEKIYFELFTGYQ